MLRNSLLGNLFISSGTPGPVLKIHCKKRTGEKNLVTCMREVNNAPALAHVDRLFIVFLLLLLLLLLPLLLLLLLVLHLFLLLPCLLLLFLLLPCLLDLQVLAEAWPGLSLGLGGVFKILEGKAKFHIMPDFSPCPITSDEEVNKWLKVSGEMVWKT